MPQPRLQLNHPKIGLGPPLLVEQLVTGPESVSGTAALTGTGALAVDGSVVSGTGTPSFPPAGIRSLNPHTPGPFLIRQVDIDPAFVASSIAGSVDLAGSGSLAVVGFRTRLGTVALAGSGSLVVAGLPNHQGNVVLIAVGTLIPAGTLTKLGVATMTAVGTLVESGWRNRFANVSVTGLGTAAIAGIRKTLGLSAESASGTLTIQGVDTHFATVALGATGGLYDNNFNTFMGAVGLTAHGDIRVQGRLLLGDGHMSRITNFNTWLTDTGRASTAAGVLALSWTHTQLLELMAAARAANVQLVLPALTPAVAKTQSVVQVAQAADVTNFLTITDVVGGVPSATGLATVAIADAAGASPTCTFSAGGALAINLGTTDANNTLTAIKAVIDAAAGAVGRAALSVTITGTASTTMAHGGANTYVAAAPGAAAGTGVKSSVAGTAAVAASRTLAIASI